jgi:hypothetical protein
MTNRVGLWIDHKKAVIVSVDERGERINKIESGVERHIQYRGATHPKSPYSPQYQQGEDRLDNRFTVHLNKFYGSVVTQLRAAAAILIFGPGEAKAELKRRLAREKGLTRAILVEPADKMTDRQISARVRRHFKGDGQDS